MPQVRIRKAKIPKATMRYYGWRTSGWEVVNQYGRVVGYFPTKTEAIKWLKRHYKK